MRISGGGVGKACLAVLGALFLSACVSKNDLQDMEATMLAEMHALRARQDSLARQMAELRGSLLDTLNQRNENSLTSRGELDRRFTGLQDQLAQIAALVGQNQRILSQMRGGSPADTASAADSTASSSGAAVGGAAPGAGPTPTAASGGSASGQAQKLYEAALQQFRRGAYGTARSGLRQFLERYPNHDLAPDAQYYIAQTFEQQDRADSALNAYARVLQLFPNSRRAPAALYKSGLLELGQGNVQDARTYFSRVVRGYPDSDEASLAREQLAKLRKG